MLWMNVIGGRFGTWYCSLCSPKLALLKYFVRDRYKLLATGNGSTNSWYSWSKSCISLLRDSTPAQSRFHTIFYYAPRQQADIGNASRADYNPSTGPSPWGKEIPKLLLGLICSHEAHGIAALRYMSIHSPNLKSPSTRQRSVLHTEAYIACPRCEKERVRKAI